MCFLLEFYFSALIGCANTAWERYLTWASCGLYPMVFPSPMCSLCHIFMVLNSCLQRRPCQHKEATAVLVLSGWHMLENIRLKC